MSDLLQILEKKQLVTKINFKSNAIEDSIKTIAIKNEYVDITLDDLYNIIHKQQDLIIDMAKLIKLMV